MNHKKGKTMNHKTRGLIRGMIADYLRGKDTPSSFDLRCFVGMIETGEALYDDFVAVGGKDLETAVCETREALLTAKQNANNS